MTRWPRIVFACLVFACLVLSACEPMRVGPPEGSEPPEGAPTPPALEDVNAPCESLTRAACLESLICTLVAPSAQRPDRYACRPARGNCEYGLSQLDQGRCEDRDGCTWAPGGCYCACRGAGQTAVTDAPETESCRCSCSGGPPPRCEPR